LGACGTQEGGCGGQRGGGGGEVTTGTAVTRSKMCFSWAAVPGAPRGSLYGGGLMTPRTRVY